MEEYDIENRSDLLFCNHCNEMVSRQTFIRHERKRFVTASRLDATRKTTYYSSSSEVSSGSEVEVNQLDEIEIAHNHNTTDVNTGSGEESNVMADNSDSEQSEQESSSDYGAEIEEVWSDMVQDSLLNDLEDLPPAIPEAESHKKGKIDSLVFWLLYFILMWQASCHISDNGLAWLLRFLICWLRVIGLEVQNEFLAQLIVAVPSSVYMLRKFLEIDRDDFTKYVVCQKCTKLYKYHSCLENINGRQVAKSCCGFKYCRGKKKICGATLVTKVTLKDGKSNFYPIKYYCYNSIINSLEKLLKKNGFAEQCEQWRKREMSDGEMADVYDGQLWKNFQTVDGMEFLKAPRNYGLMLNFDFFQPMKHRKDYSVGVFYLVLLNLPRAMRFKWENVLIIGIVPSFDKEPKDLNPFLEPAVDELKFMWRGVQLQSSLSRFSLTFRAAIMSTSSDVPATRKICGFKSHAAIVGCSRCLKLFPGSFGEKRDYSGFNRINWQPRTNSNHRKQAKMISKFKTQAKRQTFCKTHGITHYSVLLDLEYVDIIRFCTIDPMHNLFLGTAKKMFNLWRDNGVLSKKQERELEKRISYIEVPSDIGRIPTQIFSNSGSYTAEQWRNWTIVYSICCLNGLLPKAHFKCWQTFVLACKHICKPKISLIDVNIADQLFLKFCKEVEALYGKYAITPNMHLHCHIKEVILDHGPITSFWCFSFERYNGILGSITTNKRSVELQLMRRFTISRFFQQANLENLYKKDFLPLCSLETLNPFREWHVNCDWSEIRDFYDLALVIPLTLEKNWKDQSGVFLPSFHRPSCLDSDDAQLLIKVYKIMYPCSDIQLSNLSEIIQKYGSLAVGPLNYGSRLEPRQIHCSRILAAWPNGDGLVNKETFQLTPGSINYQFTHSIQLGGQYVSHAFACVRWHKPSVNSDSIGNPVKVWQSDYQPGGPSSFIPVQRIHSRFALQKLSDKDIAVTPMVRSVFL